MSHPHLEIPNSQTWPDRLFAVELRIRQQFKPESKWTYNVVGKHAEDAIAKLRRCGLPYHDHTFTDFTITNVRDLGQIDMR